MASSNESEFSEALSNLITPFTRAAKSVTSSVPAKRTRNFATRRPSKQSKPSHQKSHVPAAREARSIEADALECQENILRENEDNDLPEELPVSTSQSNSNTSYSQPSSIIVQSSSTIAVTKFRAKTSHVHDHSTQVDRPEGRCYSCNYCTKIYRCNGGTGGMARHLKDRHQIDPLANSVAIKRQQEGKSIVDIIQRGADVSIAAEEKRMQDLMAIRLDKTALEYLYIQWTVLEDIPFNQVRSQSFRTWLEYVNPAANCLLPDAGSTIRNHAQSLFKEGKQRIRHILGTALSDIHITCDVWTSPNNLALFGIVAHLTTEKAELISITLALKELQGDHTGENEALLVLDTLNDFQFRGKLGYFVMDKAYSNDSLIKSVAESLNEEGMAYDWKQRRLRCNGHVINLAVQAFLFGKQVRDYEFTKDAEDTPSDEELTQWRKLGPLGKLHNIITWIMGSIKRIQAFKKRSNGLMPHRDNSTRWNSWYDMLDWAIDRIRPAILALVAAEPELSTDSLNGEDWQILVSIRDFLLPFHDATKATEGREATLERVLPTMDFLAESFEQGLEQYKPGTYMHASIQTGYTKLLKYWNQTERAPAYIAAIVLDPTQKWSYFEDWNDDWQPNMKATMTEFWHSTYCSSIDMSERAAIFEPPAEIKKNRFLQWQDRRRPNQESLDELDRYINEPLLPPSNASAFAWWTRPEQRTRFPLLSKMAIDIYSIPAMSSEPERVFSGAKHTVSDQRNSLKADTIEILECLKSWFRKGIYTEQDLHTIVAAEDVGMEVELESGSD